MASSRTRVATFLTVIASCSCSVSGFSACSDEPSSTPTANDDAGPGPVKEEDAADDTEDAGACGPIVTAPGETCVGFGAKDSSCDPGCGQPYGYVCFNGAPPGFAGCRKASESAFGQTYCCPKNDCVAQPDQDGMCSSVSGKPHRFQCPPDGEGGNVAPPPGCTESGPKGSEVEKFYCCAAPPL